MHLIADRFLRLPDGAVLDAATLRRVTWRTMDRLECPADEQRWLGACATLRGLWHEDLPQLVDFGWLADRSRYEAFTPPSSGRCAAGEGALEFLREAGVLQRPEARGQRPDRPGQRPDRPGQRPDGPSQRPDRPGQRQDQRLVQSSACGSGTSPHAVGMRLLRRAATDRITEVFDEAVNGRPLVIGYVAEPGSGLSTFLCDVAREATAHGFVPVNVSALRRWPQLQDFLSERHVLLIAGRDQASDGCAERALTVMTLRSARGHVLLRPARNRRFEPRVMLTPFPPDALARAVHVWPLSGRLPRAFAAAAARSAGQPATFVRLLRGERPIRRALRVAEARPEYRVRPAPAEPPLASDVAHWVRRGEEAARLASRGRHAAARRTLAECSAALRRRGQMGLAAACDVRSGRLLLERGDAAGAERLFRSAYAELEDANDTAAHEAVVGIAASLLMSGALEQAEALLRAARERSHDPLASILLAECLCVQARYEHAERAIGPVLEHHDPLRRAAALRVLGDIALGRHAVADAGRAASMTLAEIDGREAPGLLAAVHELCVSVQGRVSHADAVKQHAALGLAAARAARDRVRLLSLRAARVDALCRCGEFPTPREIARLDTLADASLPALVRTRLAAVLTRVHPSEKRRTVLTDRVRAFVTASGARALDPDASVAPGTSLAHEAAALIQLVSAEPDSQRLIETICDRLRERLDAATVAIVDVEGRSVAWCGRPGSFVTPARVVVSRQPIPPWFSDRGLETAVPVEYGSRLQGVLAARWTITGQPPATTTSILVTAAACAAPALHVLNEQRRTQPVTVPANGIVGRSPAIVRLHDAIRRAGASPFPVLIEGESGVGKELAARALHAASPRRSRPFSAVNCASFQDDLFEAELFGHARGAFTGAHAERAGLFEQADGGTLFLDEISELTHRAQAKLLRALQEGEIRRLGENTARKVDVRVIAASNRPLGDETKAGRFRQDLLFRVAVIKLAVPPLRERREDIPLLAATIWSQMAGRTGTRASLSSSAVAALSRHDWPGNVRELQNVIAALAVQVPRGRVEAADVNALLAAEATSAGEPATLEAARRRFERSFVAAALASSGGRHADAARALGITRQGLAKLMKRLSVTADLTGSTGYREGANRGLSDASLQGSHERVVRQE